MQHCGYLQQVYQGRHPQENCLRTHARTHTHTYKHTHTHTHTRTHTVNVAQHRSENQYTIYQIRLNLHTQYLTLSFTAQYSTVRYRNLQASPCSRPHQQIVQQARSTLHLLKFEACKRQALLKRYPNTTISLFGLCLLVFLSFRLKGSRLKCHSLCPNTKVRKPPQPRRGTDLPGQLKK